MIDQDYYLKYLGIERWVLREPLSEISLPIKEQMHKQKNEWEDLQGCVRVCTACGLHKTRTQTVFGTGNPNADLMIIGEAPGAEEDRQGKPFVGRAGQLLTEMLRSIGFSREEVFIANILKCRPPQNRDPEISEVAECTPYLKKQIELISPKLLVAVGRIAAHFLLETKTSLSKLRGQTYAFNNIPLLVTFHPAYLLRSPLDKSKAYEDLKKVKEMM
jgi:uracil-DNA glycosylase family 4